MKLKIFSVLFFICMISGRFLWAWGSGHDYVNRDALKIMPDEIKDFIGLENQKKFVEWAHAPDTHVPFKIEQKKYPITDSDIEYLESFGAKNLYCLHSPQNPGQGGNFVLLVRAFMDKDPASSAFWMSTMMHTVADDVACNHTSQIHYLTYGFRNSNIKMGKGIGFDYSDVAGTTAGQKVIASLLKEYKPEIISGTPEEVLENIMTAPAAAATYGTVREYKIVKTYMPEPPLQVINDGIKAMAELGVYGAKKGMDIIVTAWNFAQQEEIPVLTTEIVKHAATARKEYLASRPLPDDSIYTGLLRDVKAGNGGVGILLERSGIMMAGKLSFGGRLVLAAAMRTMRSENIEYCTIDLRDLDVPETKVLDVKQVPVLVLASGSFNVSKNIKRNLERYIADGGHVLWIGGRDKGLLGDLSASLKDADSAMLPATKKYGQNNADVIDKIRIRYLPPFNVDLGDDEYGFVNNPDTTAGSQKPWCMLKLEPVNKLVVPLVNLSVDDKTITVAAGLKDKNADFKYIWVPEYLLAPFLLTDSGDEVVDVADITLDKVGASVFVEALMLLGKVDIMKIISYNIEYAKATTPVEVAAFLKPEKADIICLSEVPNGEWTALVGTELGMNYSYVGKVASANHEEEYPDKTGKYYGKYKSILSKTPLVETSEELLTGTGWSPVSVVLAKTIISGKQLLIGSLHVPSGVKDPLNSCAADIAKLMARYKNERIIISGDYNDLADSDPLQSLYKSGFNNSWVMTGYDWKNEKTCDAKSDKNFGVIDHILYRGKLQVIHAGIMKSDNPPSDHHAISAEFIIK